MSSNAKTAPLVLRSKSDRYAYIHKAISVHLALPELNEMVCEYILPPYEVSVLSLATV